jgi:transcriptional regulator with XRE-family HTH domain
MAHPVDEHVGARVRLLRRERGLSQEALGTQVGLTFQQIQKYERGANRISASKLYDIAAALGVDLVTFFEGLPGAVGADSGDPVAPKLARDEDVRRLVQIFESLPSPEERRRLLDAVAVVARPLR